MTQAGERHNRREQNPGRIGLWKRLKSLLLQCRNKLECIRKKNPKAFDLAARFIEIVWVFISTFLAGIAPNAILLVVVMSIAFGVMCLIQWALLKNENDREQEKIRQEAAKKEKKYQAQTLDVIRFSHSVAHTIRDQTAKIPHQEMRLTRGDLADFLNGSLSALETVLSDKYGVTISASAKLCTNHKRLKTFARGKNSIITRGGLAKIKVRDRKEIPVAKNYAYIAIIDRQMQYFADGDLQNLTMKEKDGDKFFCELGSQWNDIFSATIIIPIRCPNFTKVGSAIEYEVKGLICIDSAETIPEWTNSTETAAYNMTAFLADSVYGYIEAYTEQQKINKKSKPSKNRDVNEEGQT